MIRRAFVVFHFAALGFAWLLAGSCCLVGINQGPTAQGYFAFASAVAVYYVVGRVASADFWKLVLRKVKEDETVQG